MLAIQIPFHRHLWNYLEFNKLEKTKAECTKWVYDLSTVQSIKSGYEYLIMGK